MARGLGKKDWTSGEVVTATNLDTYMGPPPNLIDIDVFPTAVSQTNWDTITLSGSELYGGEKRSTSAQNAEIVWDIVLSAGTWTLELMHSTGSNRGIYTAALSEDGVTFTDVGSSPYLASASTIDGYNAGGATETRSSLTGITIASTGRYALRLKMATKNASSSNYLGALQHVQLRRTA